MSNAFLKRKDGPGKCLISMVAVLVSAGLIEKKNGYFDRKRKRGKVTRVRATSRLRAMMAKHGLGVGPVMPITTTVLRPKTLPMPAPVRERDQIVKRFNEAASQRSFGWADGLCSREVYLVRKFKDDWGKGGRLYGGFWQELSKAERASLRIDGEPVTELDFRSMQPCILYGLKGLSLPFDPYLVPGFNVDREAGKLVYNRLVNRKGTAKRVCPINYAKDLHSAFRSKEEFRAFVAVMEDRLAPISDCFGKEPWGMLQREESELLLSVLTICMDRNIPAYPIHDSLIVKHVDSRAVKNIMLCEFKNRYGVDAEVG